MRTVEQGLRDKDASVRLSAARLVGKAEPDHRAVVSVLIDVLQDRDAALRRAADVLGEVRPSDPAVVDFLRGTAGGDADADVRQAAAAALEKVRKR